MTTEKKLAAAKVLGIAGFLVLLTVTYYIRSQVLALNSTRFSADNIRAEHQLKQFKESHAERVAEYKAQMKHYEIQTKHYREMLDLYRTNYDEYVRRRKDKYRPPSLPTRPRRPESPEVRDELMEINATFIAQKHHYFASMGYLNWIAWLAALLLVGSLLYLLMFDTEGKRIFYVVLLLLSFVFMIGPSFHSIMSAIVGFLRAPRVY